MLAPEAEGILLPPTWNLSVKPASRLLAAQLFLDLPNR